MLDDLYDAPGASDASSAFDSLFSLDDQEDYEDPYAVGPQPRQPFSHLDPELARRVLANVDEEGKSLTGFATNLARDVRDFAGGIQTLVGKGLHELPRLPLDILNAAEHPVDTLQRGANLVSDVAGQYKEAYTPREGEGVLEMLGRRLYEKPFSTLMDASAVLQGPAAVAGKLGVEAGALTRAAEIGRSMDPLSMAAEGTKALALGPLAKTRAPDMVARFISSRAAADATADLKAGWRLTDKQFQYALHDPENGVFAGLNDAEKHVLFAYGEGRFQLIPGAEEQVPTRIGEPLRKDALDGALQKWQVIQQEWDRRMNRLPEQAAEVRLESSKRALEKKGLDPELPEHQAWLEAQAQQAAQEAQEQYNLRRTVSMRTVLDEARQSKWQADLEREVAEGRAADIEEAAKMIPRPVKPTPSEAMELMGPEGGVIFPHSMEVQTRDQATVGNVLTKMKEASIWKDNEGELFKKGLIDENNLERAMWAAHAQLSRGNTLPVVAQRLVEELGKEGLATELPKGFDRISDPELTSLGTHQLMSPGFLHLQDLLRGEYQKFLGRVLEVGDDAAVCELNIPELTERFMQGHSKMFELKPELRGKVYKIPQGAADSFAAYERSLRPNPSIVSRMSDAVLGPWHFSNLRISGSKLSNDAIGNVLFGVLQGVHPFSVDGIDSIITAGKAMRGRYVEGPGATASDQLAKRLAKVYDLPGVAQGAANVLMEGEYGIARNMGWFGQWLENSPNIAARGLNTLGKWTGKLNEHIDDYWRAASMVYELKKHAPEAMKGMAFSSKAMETFADYVDELASKGTDVLTMGDYNQARKAMDHFFPNYDRTSATDRLVLRHIMPYHKFYRHAANVLLKAPFEAPVKAQLARELGKRAQQDVKDTLASWGFDWNTMVPEQLRTGVPIDIQRQPDGSPVALMVNSQGPNPFSFLSGSDIGESGIGALHPMVKLALEQALGVNLFTGRKFIGPYSEAAGSTVDENGEIVQRKTAPPLLEHFLKQFRLYGTMRDMVARGRVPTDTASLLDMIEGSDGAWKLDERGFPQRRPQPYGALTPLVRQIGITPQVLQAPTQRQIAGRRSQMATLFADVFQRRPELQQSMLELMQQYAEEMANEPEGVPMQPRLF